MLLTRKTDSTRVAGPRLDRTLGARIATMDRRAFLKRSGLVAGAGAFASQLPYGAIGKAQAADETANVKTEVQAHRLHALLGRLRGRRRRRERRVDAAGAGVRLAAQSRRALREGRVDARARSRRASAEVADEARQRQVPEDQLGAGDQRGRRQARSRIRKESGPDAVFWVGSSKHSNEQAYLMRKFVSYLRHEQLRPPGAHLPLDHRRRRSQHLGLRRDDELVQRHAEHEVRDVHRQQRGRSAPGVDAAHAAREGDRARR